MMRARAIVLSFAAGAVLACSLLTDLDPLQGNVAHSCVGTSTGTCPANQYCNGAVCVQCALQDTCDFLDNDCNGKVDDGILCDGDNDGYTWCGRLASTGHIVDIDCDDNDPSVHPGASELCDGKDNDCDGKVDDGATCPNGAVCVGGTCVSNPCSPNSTTSCPANQHCDPQSLVCVNNTTVGVGQPCAANAECTLPAFCASVSVVGASVLPVSNEGMCTSACCTSEDCPSGFVCYAPGTGGRYCVDPAKLGRAALGTETAGTSESIGSRCRSGTVVSGRCADTCCSDANCTAGTVCALGSMNGHDGLFCAAGTGAGMQWATCSSGSDCHDSACVNFGFSLGNHCIQECCGSSGCGTIGALPARCYFEQSANGDYMPLCAEATVGAHTIGVSCTSNSDCISGVCYNDVLKGQMYCTDSCCQDLDCGTAFACRPAPTLPRCVAR